MYRFRRYTDRVSDPPVVLLEGVSRSYPARGGGTVEALRVDRWEVPPLAQVAVTGESGSGKSTLLHVLAGIVVPDRGRVAVHGTDIAPLPEARRDRFRGRTIGLVFQSLLFFPESFGELIRFDAGRLGKLVRDAGITLD